MTKKIPLTQGRFAIVDDDVYEWASQYKWYVKRKRNAFYAARNTGIFPFQKTTYLHREIVNAPPEAQVDHANCDGLDCRRSNMRLATNAENNRNKITQSNNTSGYKGVSWHKGDRRWRSQIKVDGKAIFIGGYHTPEAAARAYDDAARLYHGEFAKTNF